MDPVDIAHGIGHVLRDTATMDAPLSDLARIAPGLVERLQAVGGVEGVLLGGSRARGVHLPSSDFDVGLYYRGELDVAGLQLLADEYSTSPVEMTVPGGWGPWVDGGGWLIIDGTAVDLIYRSLDRVEAVWADCCVGRYTQAVQAGHPLGFWSHAYAGELALGLLAGGPSAGSGELSGELSSLQREVRDYPERLGAALADGIWESSFSIDNARKAAGRLDVSFVSGCLFRAVGVVTQALHGHERRWLINEKGAVAATATLPSAPRDFTQRIGTVFTLIEPDEDALVEACDLARRLVDEAATTIR
jgi:hypothetical protein